MNLIKTLAAGAALMIAAGSASATPIPADIDYADSVISSVAGAGNTIVAGRDDPTDALGAPDGDFYSLGLGGNITLGWDAAPFAGATGIIFELTSNRTSGHDEAVDIYSLLGGVTTFIGQVNNLAENASVLLTDAFDSILLVDVTETVFPATTSFDGFDLDAIGISAVPVPAAGLMLITAFGGMTMVRRKKKS